MSAIGSQASTEVEYTTSKFHIHKFSAVILNRQIVYQVIKMIDSVLLFINDRDNMRLTDLFVSLPTRFGRQPIGTRLLGDFMEETSKSVALRISKKLSKVVYISCNLEGDRSLFPLVEKRIFEEIEEKPDVF